MMMVRFWMVLLVVGTHSLTEDQNKLLSDFVSGYMKNKSCKSIIWVSECRQAEIAGVFKVSMKKTKLRVHCANHPMKNYLQGSKEELMVIVTLKLPDLCSFVSNSTSKYTTVLVHSEPKELQGCLIPFNTDILTFTFQQPNQLTVKEVYKIDPKDSILETVIAKYFKSGPPEINATPKWMRRKNLQGKVFKAGVIMWPHVR